MQIEQLCLPGNEVHRNRQLCAVCCSAANNRLMHGLSAPGASAKDGGDDGIADFREASRQSEWSAKPSDEGKACGDRHG